MRKRKPLLEFTDAAQRDIERCVLFHRLNNGHQWQRRRTQIRREACRITNDPKLHPIQWAHPISGLEFRRKNVDQFVIIYTYFEPCASTPNGLVSIRAVRHGAQQNVRWGVEESQLARLPLFTRPAMLRNYMPAVAGPPLALFSGSTRCSCTCDGAKDRTYSSQLEDKVPLMKPLSIGEVAKRTGVRTSALRYYEDAGVLLAAARVRDRRC